MQENTKLPDNVLVVEFNPEFFNMLFNMIKFEGGVVKAEQRLVEEFGFHPTVAKCSVRRIMKTRGW